MSVYIWTTILISPFSIIGNILVCIIVFSNPSMRTFTNYLLVNLAIADLCYSLLLALGMMVDAADNTFDWPVFCKSSNFTVHVTCGVSIATLLVISVERFYAVVKPFKFKRKRKALLYLLPLWIGVVVFMSPILFFSWEYKISYKQCEVLNRYTPPRRIYYFIIAVLFLFLPSCIIIYCYSRIIHTLWYSPQAAKVTDIARIESRRKLARMLMVVSCIFVTSWLTVCIVQLFILFDANVPTTFELISHVLIHLNTAINPAVYSLHSADFRRHMKNIGRRCICRPKVNFTGNSTFGVSNQQMSLRTARKRNNSEVLIGNFPGDAVRTEG